jgi:ADP-ribosylglycohydrolase
MSWIYDAKWTPFGKVFDVGNTTAMAMQMLKRGFSPDRSGSTESACNGNGSLMRTIPLLWYIKDKESDIRYEITKEVSSITHANIVSILSCFYYLEYARQLSKGISVYGAIETTNNIFFNKATQKDIDTEHLKHFARFLMEGFDKIPEEEINSSGYVIDTLEASIWCLLNTNNYKDAVLKAVNLGEDTDTTAAVTGGLAGVVYGLEGIPEEWLKQIARLNDIEQLVNSFNDKYSKVIDT